jgi:hypothetical protein
VEKCAAKMAVMQFVTIIQLFEWGSMSRTDSEWRHRQPGEKRVLYPLQRSTKQQTCLLQVIRERGENMSMLGGDIGQCERTCGSRPL